MTIGRSGQNAFVWIPAQRNAAEQPTRSIWREPITPAHVPVTYVYAAKSADFVKIGISRAPHIRVSDLNSDSTDHPKIVERPKLIHATVGSFQDERRLHESLKGYRVIGEWYRAECLTAPVLVAFLAKPADFGPAFDKIGRTK